MNAHSSDSPHPHRLVLLLVSLSLELAVPFAFAFLLSCFLVSRVWFVLCLSSRLKIASCRERVWCRPRCKALHPRPFHLAVLFETLFPFFFLPFDSALSWGVRLEEECSGHQHSLSQATSVERVIKSSLTDAAEANPARSEVQLSALIQLCTRQIAAGLGGAVVVCRRDPRRCLAGHPC